MIKGLCLIETLVSVLVMSIAAATSFSRTGIETSQMPFWRPITYHQCTNFQEEGCNTSNPALASSDADFAHWSVLFRFGQKDGSNNRRRFIYSIPLQSSLIILSNQASFSLASEENEVVLSVSGEVKQLFNEGRAKELQGNVPAAQRIFSKVTKISPKFVYGWSSLGDTQVVMGDLNSAEESYSTSIKLCGEILAKEENQFGIRRCGDIYNLLLNRGSVRLNNGMPKEALQDLEEAASLRGKPDAVILQNRARARELNGLYAGADRDYTVAISMTSNEVSPFWLRAALVKFQLGESLGALDLLRRVEARFPEAPEVRAAKAAMLSAKGDLDGATRKFLEIPDRQRLNFVDEQYLKEKLAWPPAMISCLSAVSEARGGSEQLRLLTK